eukprot:scaffold11945_cov59-Cyclotella_meneghiniana.AAC.1
MNPHPAHDVLQRIIPIHDVHAIIGALTFEAPFFVVDFVAAAAYGVEDVSSSGVGEGAVGMPGAFELFA